MGNYRHLQRHFVQSFRALLRSGDANVQEVVLHYESAAEEAAGTPVWMESEAPTPGTAKTRKVPALVHYISPETITARGWTQIRQGDVIADFDGRLDLAAYRNVRFEIEGRFYSQKDAGRELSEAWDTLVGGVRVSRTVLLSLESA